MQNARSILAAVCAILLAAPLSLRAADELSPKPVAKNGCSINFPAIWRIESRAGTSAFVFAIAPAADTRDGQEHAAQINISRVPLPKDDLLAVAKTSQAALAKDPTYKAVEAPRETNLNGAKCVTFGGTYSQSGKPLRNRQWLIAAPGRMYIITLTTLSSAWDSRSPTGDASVATFRVLEEK